MKEEIIRWRRKRGCGSHSFHWNGQKYRISPGQTVEVPESILGSFAEKYERLEVVGGHSRTAKFEGKESKTTEVKASIPPKGPQLIDIGGGFWDIINPDNPDKPLNDEPLSYKDAMDVLSQMGEGK